MMKHMPLPLLLILLTTLFCIQSSAQSLSQTWGTIGKAEFDLKEYEKAPEAEALILYDIGDSFFEIAAAGLQIRFERIKRIKILNDNGLAYGEVSIPYYSDGYGKMEKVKDIKAIAYNEENGQLVKSEISKEDIFDNKRSETWREKKFAIPNVREGTIIEYRYVLETPFMYNLPKWHFQDRIPTLFSKYTVRMVPFYEYSFLGQGLVQDDMKEQKSPGLERNYAGVKFKDVLYIFEKRDVPAFKDESYITSINDHVMKIDFQLSKVNYPTGATKEIITTWPKLVDDLRRRESFGKYIKKSLKPAQQIVMGEPGLSKLTPEKKAKRLIEYVKSNFRWDGNYGKSARQKPKEFLSNKKGNVGDINLFLVALLRSAGLEATPIISSTRKHGKLDVDYPFEHFFNYTLIMVKAGDKTFLTDGTGGMLNYDRIPPRCINSIGLAVDEAEGKWISLDTKGHSLNRKIIRTEIDVENQVATTNINMQLTDFEAFKYRSEFLDDESALEEEFEAKTFSDIDKIKTLNFKDVSAPYILEIEGETEVSNMGGTLVVYPFLGIPPQKNKLTQKDRSYPVDFIYAKSEEFLTTINIPEGYEVESVLDDYKANNALVEVLIESKIKERVLEINAKYFFKKAVYEPKEYRTLKRYIDVIIKRFNQEIVFQRLEGE